MVNTAPRRRFRPALLAFAVVAGAAVNLLTVAIDGGAFPLFGSIACALAVAVVHARLDRSRLGAIGLGLAAGLFATAATYVAVIGWLVTCSCAD